MSVKMFCQILCHRCWVKKLCQQFDTRPKQFKKHNFGSTFLGSYILAPTTKLWGQICHRQKAVGHTLEKYLTSFSSCVLVTPTVGALSYLTIHVKITHSKSVSSGDSAIYLIFHQILRWKRGTHNVWTVFRGNKCNFLQSCSITTQILYKHKQISCVISKYNILHTIHYIFIIYAHLCL